MYKIGFQLIYFNPSSAYSACWNKVLLIDSSCLNCHCVTGPQQVGVCDTAKFGIDRYQIKNMSYFADTDTMFKAPLT